MEIWVMVVLASAITVLLTCLSLMIMRLQKRVEELAPLAIRDGLTGIYNRRETERLLREALIRSGPKGYPVSLIVLDIDLFKVINDTDGHLRGDTVLQELVRILESNLQLGDIIGRWGGDEFVIIFSGTILETAASIAERLRQAVAGQKIAELDVTITLGVASQIGGDPMVLFHAADTALYNAKRAGRNRVGATRSQV